MNKQSMLDFSIYKPHNNDRNKDKAMKIIILVDLLKVRKKSFDKFIENSFVNDKRKYVVIIC